MEQLVLALAGDTGVLLRRDAVSLGIDDNVLRRLVKGGLLVRMRQGAYALRAVWEAASERDRHVMLSGAVMDQYDDHVALSHSSAVIQHGGPTWGLDLSSVHLTHLTGGGRKGARVIHHHGGCRVQDLTRLDDHWATSPARTVLDTASLAGPEVGVVVASDFMHRGLTSMQEVVQMEAERQMWPNSLGVHVMLQVADGRFESVGESRSAHLMWTQGLPKPEPQWKVYLPDGRLLARVDFAWPEARLLCEFDGKIKYTRYRRPGESLEETILREKRREDTVREVTGWRMVRLIWVDLSRPQLTAERIRRLLVRAA